MNYIESNKSAWEEAFVRRHSGWGDNNHKLLKSKKLYFFDEDMRNELHKIDFSGKEVAQFCCNNGRELLSLMDLGAASGTGFDFAENIIEQAQLTTEKAGIKNCSFVSCNILDIPEKYNKNFDFVFFTIGAITWFENLHLLFKKVSDCLKPGGLVLINDFHPFINMLPLPCDKAFDPNNPNKLAFSYFKKEPWVETDGMYYMAGSYESEPFTSFSHKLSDIINALSLNKIKTVKLNEYDYDIGLTDVYNNMGFPLSFILIGELSA
ncbi:MAG: class I SAM-dependent methyltransferase [Oscillospiraceae bacterium]|nr:class I SAM-dependent methyltransferase [Oscillospiraceae bacterium]